MGPKITAIPKKENRVISGWGIMSAVWSFFLRGGGGGEFWLTSSTKVGGGGGVVGGKGGYKL